MSGTEQAFCQTLTETWPSLRITVELCPWHWRLSVWRDDITRSWSGSFGPITAEFFTNGKRPR